IKARPVGRSERLWRWAQRNPAVAGLAAAVILVLVAGSAISTFFAIQANLRAKDVLQQKNRADAKGQGADANARRALGRSYVSDMRLAQRASEAGQIPWLRELLDAQTPDKSAGVDLRGFEWHYWDRLSRFDELTLQGQVNRVAYGPGGNLLAA